MSDNKKCKVQFEYHYKGSIYDNVGVVGNLNELKNWNNNDSVKLKYYEKEKIFKSDILLLSHNYNLEYKYVFSSNNDEYKWENLPNNQNRKIQINNESSLILEDIQDNPKTNIKFQPNLENKKEEKKSTKKNKINENVKSKKEKSISEEIKEGNIENNQEKPKEEIKKSIKKKVIKKKKKVKKNNKEEKEDEKKKIEIEEIKKVENRKQNKIILNIDNIDP